MESLGLEEVGVEQKRGGYVAVNEYSETNVEGVYAVGDVCGDVELTPMGEWMALECVKYPYWATHCPIQPEIGDWESLYRSEFYYL